jgi:CubicO group peptidase (beta-lactamase class C family)
MIRMATRFVYGSTRLRVYAVYRCAKKLPVHGSTFCYSSTEICMHETDRGSAEPVRSYLDALISNSKAPGIQYLALTASTVLCQYACGLADITGNVPMKPNTTLMAYSMSKTITAVAVLQLVEAHQVRLEDAIDRYVAGNPYGSSITISHLLSHTPGVPNPIPLRWVHSAESHARFDEDEALSAVLLKYPVLSFRPGTRFQYSNLDYWLLGKLVERVSGERFASYVTTHMQFVSYFSGVSAGEADFSSDGQWIVYVSYPELTLWRAHIDGSQRMQLTYWPVYATLPRWSPDGKQIAFVGTQDGKLWKIYLISSQGGTPLELFPQDRQEADATWSPDGKQIAFGRPSYGMDLGELEIQIFDLTTHQSHNVPGSQGMFSPRWSPDGSYIAALTSDSRKLMLFDVATRQWSDWLRAEDGTIGYPVWARDSKSIYIERFLTAEPSMHSLKLGATRSERFLSWNDPSFRRYLGTLVGRSPGRKRTHGARRQLARDICLGCAASLTTSPETELKHLPLCGPSQTKPSYRSNFNLDRLIFGAGSLLGRPPCRGSLHGKNEEVAPCPSIPWNSVHLFRNSLSASF